MKKYIITAILTLAFLLPLKLSAHFQGNYVDPYRAYQNSNSLYQNNTDPDYSSRSRLISNVNYLRQVSHRYYHPVQYQNYYDWNRLYNAAYNTPVGQQLNKLYCSCFCSTNPNYNQNSNANLNYNQYQNINTNISPTSSSVTIQNFSFQPGIITINRGSTVTWRNNDQTIHTVTSDTGLFDSGTINVGGTYQYTFNNPGTYNYHCGPHPMMRGTIQVQ